MSHYSPAQLLVAAVSAKTPAERRKVTEELKRRRFGKR